MGEAKEEFRVLPIPTNIDPTVFAALTKARQEILLHLLKKGVQSFANVAKDSDLQPSSLSETLKVLEEKKLICKDENKNYNLTPDGSLLALMLMQPNGRTMTEIQDALNKLLESDFGIKEPDDRRELAGNLKAIGDHLALEKKEENAKKAC